MYRCMCLLPGASWLMNGWVACVRVQNGRVDDRLQRQDAEGWAPRGGGVGEGRSTHVRHGDQGGAGLVNADEVLFV